MEKSIISVIGAGLAGSECAYQLAKRGHSVALSEMKPLKRSPAHHSNDFAELVCSNSFRSDNPESAIGLLHEELRAVESLILTCADENRVPAGDALAVDRTHFARSIKDRLKSLSNLRISEGEVTEIADLSSQITVIATGPLTSDRLTQSLESYVGTKLYFYDSIAPIVAADSVDMSIAFLQSRYNKGGGDDYLNLPLDKEQYGQFISDLNTGEKVNPHGFEEQIYFEGCLPIEVMAERGEQCLAFGPMKPVGLLDPRTGQRPYAVVQLRKEDLAGSSYNMVGFQTRLTWTEQKRIFRKLPGMADAELLRMGQIHRNTFIDSPKLLQRDFSLREHPWLFFAGQITGVEGYVESAASGYWVALAIDARLRGRPFVPPPASSSMGSLYRHVTGEAHPEGHRYQPCNVIHGLFPPLKGKIRKPEKKKKYMERARIDFQSWLADLSGEASEERRTA